MTEQYGILTASVHKVPADRIRGLGFWLQQIPTLPAPALDLICYVLRIPHMVPPRL